MSYTLHWFSVPWKLSEYFSPHLSITFFENGWHPLVYNFCYISEMIVLSSTPSFLNLFFCLPWKQLFFLYLWPEMKLFPKFLSLVLFFHHNCQFAYYLAPLVASIFTCLLMSPNYLFLVYILFWSLGMSKYTSLLGDLTDTFTHDLTPSHSNLPLLLRFLISVNSIDPFTLLSPSQAWN